MPARALRRGASFAAISALVSLAALLPAQAAKRCAASEIYRPTLGVCQPKEEAASEGIFNFWPFSRKSEEAETKPADKSKTKRVARVEKDAVTAVAEKTKTAARPEPKQKREALAQIERRAPLSPPPQDALAFSPARKARDVAPAVVQTVSPPLEPRPVPAVAVSFKPREASPFGSLIAFDPVGR